MALSNVIPTPRRARRGRGDDIKQNAPRTAQAGAGRRPASDETSNPQSGSRVPREAPRHPAGERCRPRARPSPLAATPFPPSRAGMALSNVIPTPRRARRARGNDIQQNASRTAQAGAGRRPASDETSNPQSGSRVPREAPRHPAGERCRPRARPAPLAATPFPPSRTGMALSNVIPTPRRARKGSRKRHSTERISHRAGRRGTPPCIGRDVQPTKWVARPARGSPASCRGAMPAPSPSCATCSNAVSTLPHRDGSLERHSDTTTSPEGLAETTFNRTHLAPRRPARDAAPHRTRRPTHTVGRASRARLPGILPGSDAGPEPVLRHLQQRRFHPPAPGWLSRTSFRYHDEPGRGRGDDIQQNAPRTGQAGAGRRPASDETSNPQGGSRVPREAPRHPAGERCVRVEGGRG